MGRLTTHVLDTYSGVPAEGMLVELYQHDSDLDDPYASATTNADGRCAAPLLDDDESSIGEWELSFYVGDYFNSIGIDLAEPPFLDVVTISFGISEESHYHVPLLVSPWSYSTYRGS